MGILKAQGRVVAFLDVKGYPSNQWIEAGMNRVASSTERIVAGKYHVVPSTEKLSDQVYGLLYLNNQKNVSYNYGVTAGNLFVDKSAFMKYGLFDDAHLSGNDIKWTKRAHIKGAEVVYDSEAMVTYQGQSYKELEQSVKKYLSGISQQEKDRKVSSFSKMKSLLTYMLPMKYSTFKRALTYRRMNHLSWNDKCYLWLMTWRMKTKMAKAYLNNLSK